MNYEEVVSNTYLTLDTIYELGRRLQVSIFSDARTNSWRSHLLIQPVRFTITHDRRPSV